MKAAESAEQTATILILILLTHQRKAATSHKYEMKMTADESAEQSLTPAYRYQVSLLNKLFSQRETLSSRGQCGRVHLG